MLRRCSFTVSMKENIQWNMLKADCTKYLPFDVLTFRFDRCWSRFMLPEHRELRGQEGSSDRSGETRIWKSEVHCSGLCFISGSTHPKDFSVGSQHKYRHDTLRWCPSCSLPRFTGKPGLYFRHMPRVLSSFLIPSSSHSSEPLSFSTLDRNAVLALHNSS